MSAAKSSPAVSPIWLVLIGILSVQLGAGVAKSLFDEISPTAIVWLRLVTSSVILWLLVRPRSSDHRTWGPSHIDEEPE